jgi:hypothetical protein
MAKSFLEYWPEDVRLRVYTEGFKVEDERIERYRLDGAAPWLQEFKTKYGQPEYQGLVSGDYNYRTDAIRFVHKIAAIGAAAETIDCDVLIWMDADIVTHSQITRKWLDQLFPPGFTLAWLDRSYKEPECGFLMFRMPDARAIIDTIVDVYRTGSVFQFPQTHDSYVINRVVEKAIKKGQVNVHSLSGDKRAYRHPFINGVLGEKMDHLKGLSGRKERGKSFTTDLKNPRSEPYWQW